MNSFAQELLVVAKEYLGPAAQTFLAGELHALGVNANTVTPAELDGLVERVRTKAARAMGDDRAAELAARLATCGGKVKTVRGGHRLASEAALKHLENGRPQKAEIAYRELVAKHGDTDSYCGLARAQAAVGKEAEALATLRDGAAQFARSGDRVSAVALLVEAVAIAPSDLSAHRRLAAALANQGDLPSAVAEYERFVDVALTQHDTRRAWLELAYGRETLGDLPGLRAIVDRVAAASGGSAGPAPRNGPIPQMIARSELAPRGAQGASATTSKPAAAAAPAQAAPPAAVGASAPKPATILPPEQPLTFPELDRPRAAKTPTPATHSDPRAHPLNDRLHAAEPQTRPAASHTAVVLNGASTVTHADKADLAGATDAAARAGLSRPVAASRAVPSNGHVAASAYAGATNGTPATPASRAPRTPRPPVDRERELSALVPRGTDLAAATVASARASLLITMRDARATDATLDAARRLLALGKLQSASDLLLDFIGHGFTDREAQRLLIEVDCAIGRRDTAREKCHLLSMAYRLDGQAEIANDVDRIARVL